MSTKIPADVTLEIEMNGADLDQYEPDQEPEALVKVLGLTKAVARALSALKLTNLFPGTRQTADQIQIDAGGDGLVSTAEILTALNQKLSGHQLSTADLAAARAAIAEVGLEGDWDEILKPGVRFGAVLAVGGNTNRLYCIRDGVTICYSSACQLAIDDMAVDFRLPGIDGVAWVVLQPAFTVHQD